MRHLHGGGELLQLMIAAACQACVVMSTYHNLSSCQSTTRAVYFALRSGHVWQSHLPEILRQQMLSMLQQHYADRLSFEMLLTHNLHAAAPHECHGEILGCGEKQQIRF